MTKNLTDARTPGTEANKEFIRGHLFTIRALSEGHRGIISALDSLADILGVGAVDVPLSENVTFVTRCTVCAVKHDVHCAGCDCAGDIAAKIGGDRSPRCHRPLRET